MIEVADVPLYVQDELQCGPASLAMVLTWGGTRVSPQALKPLIYSPSRQGTLQPLLVAAARHYGYTVFEVRGLEALLDELAAGHPVIVLENLAFRWFPRWHYSVVTGVDPNSQRVRLHSGRAVPQSVDLSAFLKTWSRSGQWAMLALPAGRLPASLAAPELVTGVAAMEQIGQTTAAQQGYQAILRRYPQNLTAQIGLANVHYAQNDLVATLRVLRQTTQDHPESGMAWNNLASALHANGKLDEALSAAQKAVRLGGPLRAVFEATLAEIEQSRR